MPQPHSVCTHRKLIPVLLSPVPLDSRHLSCSGFFLSLFSFLPFHKKVAMGKDTKGKSSNPSTDLYSLLHQASKLMRFLQHCSVYPHVFKITTLNFHPGGSQGSFWHQPWPHIPTSKRNLSPSVSHPPQESLFCPLIQLMYVYVLFIGARSLMFSVMYFFQTSLFSSLQ